MLRQVALATTGLVAAKVGANALKKVHAKDDEYKWDYNWDKRQPQENWTDDQKAKFTSKHTRWVYLIRHGQYEDGPKDKDRCLSAKGREQARECGKYLKSHVFNKSGPTQFVHSTMLRATETAQLIQEELGAECPLETCDLIREGVPCSPEPPLAGWPEKPWNEYKDAPRIEAGFRRYIRRAKPESTETEKAIVVCHGNVIRYFLCRGLQESYFQKSLSNGTT